MPEIYLGASLGYITAITGDEWYSCGYPLNVPEDGMEANISLLSFRARVVAECIRRGYEAFVPTFPADEFDTDYLLSLPASVYDAVMGTIDDEYASSANDDIEIVTPPRNSIIAEYVDRNGICNYSFKPRWRFLGTGTTFLGFEAEVEADENVRNSLRAGASIANQALGFGEYGFLKSDGSIDYGFEIVTQPMAFDWSVENFPWDMFGKLEQVGIHAERTCGIHVHVNRKAFTNPNHVYRWLGLIYRNEAAMQRIARRGSVTYCRWDTSVRDGMAVYAKGESHSAERYSTVNVQNRDTFEVRMFAGSVNPREIQAATGLVDASVEYTRGLTAHDIAANDGWSFAAFRDWCKGQSRWEALESEMDDRVTPRFLTPNIRKAERKPPWRPRRRASGAWGTYNVYAEASSPTTEPIPSWYGAYDCEESPDGQWYWCMDCNQWHEQDN